MKRIAIIASIIAAVVMILFLLLGNQRIFAALQPNKVQPSTSSGNLPSQTSVPVNRSGNVVAECKLVPARYVNLSFNTAGLVEDVLVSEGQTVSKGQLMARLSNIEQLQASVTSAQLDLINSQQALKILYDEAPLRAAEALQALAKAPQAVTDAQSSLNSLTSGATASQTDIDVAKANLDLAQKKLKDAQDAYRPYANKTDNSLMRASLLSKLSQAEKEYEAALRKYNSMVGGTPNKTVISQAEADLAVAQAQQAEAQRRYEILKNGPNPDDVTLAQARLANAEAQLAAAQAALATLELRAPFTGTIATIDLKPGEYVAPGVPILLLVDYSDWQIETTDLTELNVVRIAIGDTAVITFDAIPDLKFYGQVQKVNTVGENRQGDITYTVFTDIDQLDDRLKWNMTCSVSIGDK